MKIDKDNTIFLLGGKDLEMKTIRDFLEKKGLECNKHFFDKGLSWGKANLSAYKDEVEQVNLHITIYAIELDDDSKELSSKVTMIDHHGKYNHKKASLLQVLELFEEPPSRRERLVAANDARYINGMICEGASEEEIVSIRAQERKILDISPSDMRAAQNDVRSKKESNGIDIICATTDKFTAITDVLHLDEKLKTNNTKHIIYNENKIVFYGFEKELLQDLLKKQQILECQYYYGGGNQGYLGINDNILSKDKIKIIKESIIKHFDTNCEDLFSTHTVLFPFRFDYISEDSLLSEIREFTFYKENSIHKRINLEELFHRLGNSKYWEYEKFSLQDILESKEVKYYGEYNYFYDYAKEALYNFNDEAQEGEISYYYDSKVFSGSEEEKKSNRFIVTTPDKTYNLQIDGMSLRVFATGVAVLSIELENYENPSFSEVKAINEYIRRFYPPYLIKDECKLQTPSNMACSFEISSPKLDEPIVESFDSNTILVKNSENIRISNHLMGFFEGIFTQCLKDKDKFYIQPMLDDRMFVISWYGNDETVNQVCCENANEYYPHSDSWYEYVFVDKHNDCTVKNDWMKYDLLQNATYDRWSGDGTLFGITRYSFIALSPNDFFGNNILRIHMNTMYFQMMLLLLAMRTSILRFSDEIAAVAKIDATTNSEDRLGELYKLYQDFYNRLYFKEVTHQDQGIELYDMALKQMKIPEHIEKLDSKFTKLHDFANLQAEKIRKIELNNQNIIEKEIDEKRTKEMNNLTRLGAYVLIPSLVISIIGIDEIKALLGNCTHCSVLVVVLSFILSAFVGDLLKIKEVKNDKSK